MLTEDHLVMWREHGFIKVANFLTQEEATACRQWIIDIEGWPDSQDRWMHHYESTPEGIKHSRTENVSPYHPALDAFLNTGKIFEAVSKLLGEPAVLYKEKINYKYPGAGGYAAHQDAPAYPDVSHHVTCFVSTNTVTVENGCLFFASYPESQGLLPMDAQGCISLEIATSLDWSPIETRPRDVLFFHSYTPHKSGENRTNAPRRILYATYNARSAGDFRASYYAKKRAALSNQEGASPSSIKGQISLIGHFQGHTVKRT